MILVRMSKPILHSEYVIARLVRILLAVVSILVIACVAVLLAQHKGEFPRHSSFEAGASLQVFGFDAVHDLVQALPLLLILLVSAIPVALPTMFTGADPKQEV